MNKKQILFLDDSPIRKSQFETISLNHDFDVVFVSTANDCIDALNKHEFDIISLDHDLNGEIYVDSNRDDCGFEVVRYIMRNKDTLPSLKKSCVIITHTYNKYAGVSMYNDLTDSLSSSSHICCYCPFGTKAYYELFELFDKPQS